MSTIEEALRKAQKKRDRGLERSRWSLSAQGRKGRPFSGAKGPGILLSLLVIFLAFALYSWLDFGTLPSPAGSGTPPARPASPPPKRVIDAGASYDRARAFQRAGQTAEAKRLYRETLRSDPGHVDALNNLGVIYLQEKAFEEALMSFEKAVRLKPGTVDPYYNLACLHAIKGELEESLARLNQAVLLEGSVRQWARNDSDLGNLRGMPEFQRIIGTGAETRPGNRNGSEARVIHGDETGPTGDR